MLSQEFAFFGGGCIIPNDPSDNLDHRSVSFASESGGKAVDMFSLSGRACSGDVVTRDAALSDQQPNESDARKGAQIGYQPSAKSVHQQTRPRPEAMPPTPVSASPVSEPDKGVEVEPAHLDPVFGSSDTSTLAASGRSRSQRQEKFVNGSAGGPPACDASKGPAEEANGNHSRHVFPPIEVFDIDRHSGYLPPIPPLQSLPPHPAFRPWDHLVNHLSRMLMTPNFSERILALPELPFALLEDCIQTAAQLRRLYATTAILVQAWVYGRHSNSPANTAQPRTAIPKLLARPLVFAAKRLGIRPIVSHALVDLWNYDFLDPSLPPEERYQVSNLKTLHSFTGAADETWFYFAVSGVEILGGSAASAMRSICLESRELVATESPPTKQRSAELLQSIATELRGLKILVRDMTTAMYSNNDYVDPHIFYNQIRHYHRGWSDEGMVYEGVSREEIPMDWPTVAPQAGDEGVRLKLGGASAAQSTAIRALVVFLDVAHYPTGSGPHAQRARWATAPPSHPDGGDADVIPTPETSSFSSASSSGSPELPSPPTKTVRQPFFDDMEMHMPAPHRQFLRTLATNTAYFHHLVRSSSCTPEIRQGFSDLTAELTRFRDKHLQLVTRYISIQKNKAAATSSAPASLGPPRAAAETGAGESRLAKLRSRVPFLGSSGLSASAPSLPMTREEEYGAKGTSGTDLIPFLKQARDETKHHKP